MREFSMCVAWQHAKPEQVRICSAGGSSPAIGRPQGIGATIASWHNILFLLYVTTVKKHVAPFACDPRYGIISLSCHINIVGFRFTQPNLHNYR